MKNIKQIVILLCVGLIVIFNSCTDKKIEQPHLQAIPDDAAFVVVVENKQLVDKGGLANLNEFNFFKKIRREMSADNVVALMMIEKFVTSPVALGLDIDRSYMFGVVQNEDFFVAATFKVDNASTFESNVKKLMDENSDDAVEIIDKGDFKLIQSDNAAIAWNKELLIAGGNSQGTADFEKFFSMPENKSIISNSDFNSFNSRKYDIGFWFSYGAIADLTIKSGLNLTFNEMMADMFLHGYVNFDAGELKLSFLNSPESKVIENNKKYPFLKKDFDKNLLSAFPEKSFLTLKLAINIPAYIKMMQDMSNDMDASFNEIMSDPTASAVINGLGGDILFSLYGFAQGPLPLPLAGIAFTVKSKDDFDKLISLVPLDLVKKEDHYVLSYMGLFSAYIAYKDNKVLITADSDAISNFTGKGFDKSLSSSPLSKNLSYFYINLDIDSYPESIRNMIQGNLGVDEQLKYLQPYRDFTVTMVSDFESVISLRFKDTGKNALQQLIKNFDELAGN